MKILCHNDEKKENSLFSSTGIFFSNVIFFYLMWYVPHIMDICGIYMVYNDIYTNWSANSISTNSDSHSHGWTLSSPPTPHPSPPPPPPPSITPSHWHKTNTVSLYIKLRWPLQTDMKDGWAYEELSHSERNICVSVTQSVSLSRKWVRMTLKVHRLSEWVNRTHLAGKWGGKNESIWLLNVSLLYEWVRLTLQSGSFLEQSSDSSNEKWYTFFSQCSTHIECFYRTHFEFVTMWTTPISFSILPEISFSSLVIELEIKSGFHA